MRLVIDLQGAQGMSRARGIGRLSRELALAMARNAGHHEVLLALNGAFPVAVNEIMNMFSEILPPSAFHIWQPTGGTAANAEKPAFRLLASQHIRAQFLRSLSPDLVHVSSLFEGAGDDIVTGLPPTSGGPSSVATLYDLIPLIRRDQYLDGAWAGNVIRDWYLNHVTQLRRMPGLLAISESARSEAIEHLGLPPEQIFNIRAGVTETFRPVAPDSIDRCGFLAEYGLPQSYVLFLGGGDLRKNEIGLVKAYSLLPQAIQTANKLVIVGGMDETAIRSSASAIGIAPENLILIPFVAEHQLSAIYSFCTVFVFPSLHEGFGLPALEAMACGAPVIGSNTSSLPEVIGRSDALFDPHRPEAIAAKLYHVLSDQGFRRSLAEHARIQASGFTWAESARRSWSALETIAKRAAKSKTDSVATLKKRFTLALTSPIPPVSSGIADYTSFLLPALSRYYDVTLVAQDPASATSALHQSFDILSPSDFVTKSADFDRVIHQIGNSEFHLFQINRLIPQVGGVVVLHDAYLSNILDHVARDEGKVELFNQTLLSTHGIAGVRIAEREGTAAAVQQLPCSLAQIRQSLGVILHSEHARSILLRFYGASVAAQTTIVSPIRDLSLLPATPDARTRLGLASDAFIVASFGGIAATKMPDLILVAFAATALSKRQNVTLVFVGEAEDSVASDLAALAEVCGLGQRFVLTGRTAGNVYRDWLAAADIAVQLRRGSRGESSAAAADCLAAGLPMIVNAHGSLAELPGDVAIILADRFHKAELASAIDLMADDPELRRDLASRGRSHANAQFGAEKVGLAYYEAIEGFYAARSKAVEISEVLASLAEENLAPSPDSAELQALGRSLAASFPLPRPRRLMFDIDALSAAAGKLRSQWEVITAALLTRSSLQDRAELVRYHNGMPVCAWSEAARILAIEPVPDAPAGLALSDDVLFVPVWAGSSFSEASLALALWAKRGGALVVLLTISSADLLTTPAGCDDIAIALDVAFSQPSNAAYADTIRVLREACANVLH